MPGVRKSKVKPIVIDGTVRCGAKKKDGNPCTRLPIKDGNGRCRYHGGKAPVGIASPNYKTGRYSKALPERLRARYYESSSDGDLLAMRDEIALTDARLADMLDRVETGEPGELWAKLSDSYEGLVLAMDEDDSAGMRLALGAMKSLMARGASDWAAWQEIGRLVEQRRKLSESEQKRLVQMQQMISAEQLLVLLGAVADTIKRHVHDRQALADLSADIRRLIPDATFTGARS